MEEEKKEPMNDDLENRETEAAAAEAPDPKADPENVTEEAKTEETSEKEELPQQEKKGSHGFFKKKEKKKDERDEKIEALTDRYTRLMAEFDNYRKRTDKEKGQMFDMGATSTVEKILPVIDSFERGLQSVPEEKREDSVYTGMKLIYDQLFKALTDLGVEPMNAEGKEFDPNLHNAVMQVENEDLKPGTVAAELQKGYLFKGNVLRHAMVSVVQES